jgi:hypothetical protein
MPVDGNATNYAIVSDGIISNALIFKTGTDVVSHHELLLIELQ